ncbi:MAG: carboxypeptidase regulatory-like domain-containing protein [Pirellulales bacterium]|nr:carboxypeptidase regulatory-like domain-containing protein [Pirellulales bacterium]
MTRRLPHVLGPIALALAAVVGCGGMYDSTVKGVVKLDGAPLPRGTIKYVPDSGAGAPAYSIIAADGSYSLLTGREEGLPPGAYTVTVVANEPSKSNPDSSTPPAPGKPLSPPWYRDAASSPLKQTVAPGHNDLNIDLSTTPPDGWKPPARRR